MCETSNTPARSRTAWCSARMPSYCTGISQPANGTSRAPAATWRSCRGVRWRASEPAAIGGRTLAARSGGGILYATLRSVRSATTARNVSTTAGSNCVPAQRRSSSSASCGVRGGGVRALGRHRVEGVATATMREPSGIASAAGWSG